MPAPANVRPFKLESLGEHLTLENAVLQAMGAASVCWDHIDQAGQFDSDQAGEIADALLAFVRGRVAELLSTGDPEFIGTLDDLWHDLEERRSRARWAAEPPPPPLADRVALYRIP